MKDTRKDGQVHKKKVKVMEVVIFVPFTPESNLFKTLSKNNADLTESLNTPLTRFVERGEITILDLIGRNNSWTQEAACGRTE